MTIKEAQDRYNKRIKARKNKNKLLRMIVTERVQPHPCHPELKRRVTAGYKTFNCRTPLKLGRD